MTVAMQLGNVVDGMIVGNLLGADAMAAIELSMPVLLILQMLAMGGAAEAAVLLGNDSMAVYSVCANAVLIAELCVGGVIGLVPNIAGILYGEKDYYGIRVLCKKVLIYSYLVILGLLFFGFPQGIAGLFGITEGEMLIMCKMALRIFACSFLFYVFK